MYYCLMSNILNMSYIDTLKYVKKYNPKLTKISKLFFIYMLKIKIITGFIIIMFTTAKISKVQNQIEHFKRKYT